MISLTESQRLHELIGVTLEDARNGETGDIAELESALCIAAIVVSDLDNVPKTTLRKRTVFAPCKRHALDYAEETRYRRAEVFVEGGWSTPCSGGLCSMKPGTDFYAADFVAAHPTYKIGDDQ